MALSPRSPRGASVPRRSPGKGSPIRGTPRLADLAEEDKEKVAMIVKQFTEACRNRDELADVVKEQESQVHHLIRERWLFTQENTRFAKEVEHLRQKVTEAQEANCEQVCEAREKMKKICSANKQLSEICTEQKQRLTKQHTKEEEMETRYQTMVSAMKCLELKLENSKKSIRKLRHHLDTARETRCFPARTVEGSTQTERGWPAARPCCCAESGHAPPPPASCSTMARHCPLTSSGPLSRPATRQASDVSTGPLSQSADTAVPTVEGGAGAPQQLPAAGEPGRPPHGAPSQVTCQGSAASRWTLAGPACPGGGGGGGGGLLEWAAGGGGGGAEPAVLSGGPAPAAAACPCWHQVSAAGQLALSPQAVEDWMLSKLFFSGRPTCPVAHIQLG